MRIIPYEEQYRDDMIFMVLSAKDALGRVPRLNEDLLDVKKHYLQGGTGSTRSPESPVYIGYTSSPR